jgi:hypothetical protein
MHKFLSRDYWVLYAKERRRKAVSLARASRCWQQHLSLSIAASTDYACFILYPPTAPYCVVLVWLHSIPHSIQSQSLIPKLSPLGLEFTQFACSLSPHPIFYYYLGNHYYHMYQPFNQPNNMASTENSIIRQLRNLGSTGTSTTSTSLA